MSSRKRKSSASSAVVVRKPNALFFDRTAMTENLMESNNINDCGFAARVVNEFFDRFMKLKMIANDADASLLSPTHLIDAVWQQAILQSAAYAHFCETQVGFFVHYLPFDGDTAARVKRYERTFKEYNAAFGAPNDVLWPHPDAFDDLDAWWHPESSEIHYSAKHKRGISIIATNGKTFTVRFAYSTTFTLRDIKLQLLRKEGIPVDHQRLFHKRKELQDRDKWNWSGWSVDDKLALAISPPPPRDRD